MTTPGNLPDLLERGTRTFFNDNSLEKRNKALKLLRGIAQHVLEEPDEIKFRKIKIEKLLPRLQEAEGAVTLLTAMGFIQKDGFFILPETSSLEPICSCLEKLEEREEREKKITSVPVVEKTASCCVTPSGCCESTKREKPKSEAERQLEAVLAEREAEINAFRKKKAGRALMKKNLEASKKDKRARGAVASTGQDLQFGARYAKPTPPPACAPSGG